MKKVNVYVGCGLTKAPKRFRNSIALFKEALAKIPWIEVLYFADIPFGEMPDPLFIIRQISMTVSVGLLHS